jgi:hypothetical protein
MMHQKEVRDLMSEARPEIGSPPPRKREGIGRWRWVAVVVALATAHLALPQYFVDCTLGSNGIGTSGSPWNTLASVPALGSNATLSIKRGCECVGQITVAASATNVTIEDYGTAPAKPIVNGSKPIATNEWSHVGNGVWRHNLGSGWNEFVRVRGLYSSAGARLPLARYPNASADENAAWLRNFIHEFNYGNALHRVTATAAIPSGLGSLAGSTLVMRTSNHEIRQATVTGVSGAVVNMAPNLGGMGTFAASNYFTTYSGSDIVASENRYDWGFFLQDHPALLDLTDEWCFVPEAGAEEAHVLLLTSSTTTAPTGIRVSVHEFGVEILRAATTNGTPTGPVTIEDIDFRQTNQHAIAIRYGDGDTYPYTHHVAVRNCDFSNSRAALLDAQGYDATQHEFTGNTVADCWEAGIGARGDGSVCSGNSFARIGLDPGYINVFGSGTAIGVKGQGITIEDNSMVDMAYAGIATGGSGTVRKNYVRNAMALLNDGGGITFDDVDGLVIEDNITLEVNSANNNLHGVATKRNDTNAPYTDRTTLAMGIYYGDKYIRNTQVRGNVCADGDKGIYVDHSQCAQGATVASNTLFNNAQQLGMGDASCYLSESTIDGNIFMNQACESTGDDNLSGTVQGQCNGSNDYPAAFSDAYTENILYCIRPEQICLHQGHIWPAGPTSLVDFGTFESNAYFNPFGMATHQQQVKYCLPGYTSVAGADYYSRAHAVVPWGVSRWSNGAESEQGALRSPLRLPQHVALAVPAPVAYPMLADPCNNNNFGYWNDSANPAGPVGLTEGSTNFLRFRADASWIHRANGNYLTEATLVTGWYRIRARMRSNHVDALRVGSVYSFNLNKYVPPFEHITLTPDWEVHEVVIYVDNSTQMEPLGQRLWVGFQNVQAAMGNLTVNPSLHFIDIDYVEVHRVTIDNAYIDGLANDHRLFYNCPLDDAAADTYRNVHDPAAPDGEPSTFLVPGTTGQCWSDVQGNFYGAGDEIALDEWASIVLFRMDVPNGNLALNGSGEHHIVENTLWTDNMNVEGSVVVNDGFTLTIDGAHIGFAASTPSLTTNITVRPGGTLVLRNGATLRNWMGCGDPGMWDGVKALGTGTTAGAGLVVMESGASIMDAHTAIRCAEGDVGTIFGGDTEAGGTVQATDAIFENNEYDVVSRPHTIVNPNAWGPSGFTRCTFRRTRALHDATAEPGSRISLMQSAPTEFIGCTFENTSGVAPTDPGEWGFGIHAINTRIRVVGDEVADKRGAFKGLSAGILHSAYEPTAIAVVDECDFSGNGRGLLFWGTDNSNVTRCTFSVADVQVEDLSVEGAYGAYLYGCSGFEVEENSFTGPDGAQPTVGLVLRDCMQEDNMFYNNRFNGFVDPAGQSAGTIIMGNNANADQSVGLRIKCNDYSATATNDYDVAFTGSTVNIANEQGTGVDATTPAGNTFANVDPLTCDGNEERHFFVEDALNPFTYWHHEPQPQVELLPHCSNAPNTNSNSNWDYEKADACPVDLSGLIPIEDDDETAEDAHAEHDVLVEVYDDWTDGGSTEGLIQYILNSANDSYAVRNKLMLVAPSVTIDGWRAALITRTPALNSWHLAQALLANSPLQQEVLDMVESLPIEPFYKELVYGGQSGVSMHSIYQSEIAHFYSEKTTALQAMVRKSLLSGDARDIALTHARLTASKSVGEHEAHLALYLAEGDLTSTRTLIDAQLQGTGDLGYWQVQDLLLTLKEESMGPQDLDGNGEQTLRGIAAAQGQGAAQAQAWLALLGHPEPEVVILPANSKRRKPVRERTTQGAQTMLAAYPNPSNGPVYLVYQVPKGVDQAEVMVSDAQGRLLKRERIAPKDGILEILPKELAAGVHIAALYFDGIQVGTAKLNLMR